MTDFNTNLPKSLDGRNSTISPREIILRYSVFLPWIFLSLALALGIAYVKIRYTPEVFRVTSTLLVKDEASFSSNAEKFDDILFAQPNKNLQDEMQMIRARNMAKRVVKSLGLEVQYFSEGKIKSSEMSASESPIYLKFVSFSDSLHPFDLTVFVVNDKQFSLTENGARIYFDQPFETSTGIFSLQRTGVDLGKFPTNQFYIYYSPLEQRSKDLVSSLSASQSGESNNIIQLTFETENIKLGLDIVNQWMKEYQQAGLEDKKQIAVNTLHFIDDQMDTVKYELSGVEKNLLGYRERNRVINPEQQSIQIFSSVAELEKEITKANVQLQVVDNIINYISDNSSPYRQVGSTLGIEEPSLIQQISEFNKFQIQRETLLKTTTRNNPVIIDLEAAIEKLRINIIQNLQNIRQAYSVSLSSLTSKSREVGKEVSTIPAKEKQLLDITRRQKILEELYSYLLQKKLETSIGSASTISNVRVIESATALGFPVMPNRRSIYTIALFLGLMLPILVIFLMEYLNDKVRSKGDIQKVVDAPIIGEVGHSEEKTPLVVSKVSRKFISEQFRIIRTNLQYVLPKQDKAVILVTSSTSGEGKSFISTNIGAVLALTGKKTAILEMDIRKPKIMSSLGLQKKTGITNFIIGKAAFEELPVPVPNVENLFVIPCGPVPPNPSELILDSRLDDLFAEAKEHFDYIIIDTAPVGLVSDAVVLGRFADASLYIIRHNYTYKKQLQLLYEIYANGRLKKLSLVVNDIVAEGGYGKYYGYGGYGYSGYGYGYGSDYFEDTLKNSGFFRKIKQRFGI